jgi:hypothetical protein
MTLDGRLFLPPNLAPRTLENGGSYSLPTPTASDYGTGGNGINKGKQKQILSLGTMARKNLWPTPTVCGNNNRAGASKKSGDGLATAAGGPLNPEFVEWLMGFHLGVTALEDWATQWFRPKQGKHSNASRESGAA